MNPETRPQRPTTFESMVERQAPMMTPEGIQKGLAFQPRATDIIISPFGKSGTTWLQQIVHGLRTRGDMDFDDISRVAPWIETAHDLGLDLDAPQKAHPRAFKSHCSWTQVPKGARYVVSLRDPKDALVSMYRFMEGWFFEPGTISIETLARRRYFVRGESRDYWSHLVSWWEHRHDANVLVLSFEEVKLDLPGTVRRVAEFIGVELDPELLDIVVRQSSLDFMLKYKDRFDDLLMRQHSEAVAGLPPGSDSAKVRSGKVGSHRTELPKELSLEMDSIWQEEVEAKLGFPTYEALRKELVAAA